MSAAFPVLAPIPVVPPPTLWSGAYGGAVTTFIDAASSQRWTATLTPAADGWLKITAGATGAGPGVVELEAQRNTGRQRNAALQVSLAGRSAPLVWPVAQISAEPLAVLNGSVLAVPFPTVPTVMEIGIVGGFVAEQIKKIPEPFDLIALALVEIVVPLLGLVAIAVRSLLSALVPEPKTWFGAPVPYDTLTTTLPATAVFITEETALLDLYIVQETVGGG